MHFHGFLLFYFELSYRSALVQKHFKTHACKPRKCMPGFDFCEKFVKRKGGQTCNRNNKTKKLREKNNKNEKIWIFTPFGFLHFVGTVGGDGRSNCVGILVRTLLLLQKQSQPHRPILTPFPNTPKRRCGGSAKGWGTVISGGHYIAAAARIWLKLLGIVNNNIRNRKMW